MSNSPPTSQFYEGCGREGPIRCIFLSEFHPIAGPKITCQVKFAAVFLCFLFVALISIMNLAICIIGTRRICFQGHIRCS